MSKNNRKERLIKFKNKQKIKTKMSEQVKNQQQLPSQREVPYWDAQEKLEIIGGEFEMIFNWIQASQAAMMAVNSVMQRNLINDKIKIRFEKLVHDEKGNPSYIPMTDEEQAPHLEQFNNLLAALKTGKLPSEMVAETNAEVPTAPLEVVK